MARPRRQPLLFLVAALAGAAALDVVIDEATGAYEIVHAGTRYFRSGPTSFRSAGQTHSTADGTLVLSEVFRASDGLDGLGRFNETCLLYNTSDGAAQFQGNIRVYDAGAIFLEAFFVSGATDVSVGDADKTVSAFPSFEIDDDGPLRGQCQWTSWDYPDAGAVEVGHHKHKVPFESPTCRPWTSETVVPSGIAGTGPMVVFAEDDNMSFVLSPMSHFMAASLASSPGAFSFGVAGNVTAVDPLWAMKTVVVLGEGIGGALGAFGSLMRGWFGKRDAAAARSADVTLQYLGYSTDNGAYYYYNSDDYLRTLVDVRRSSGLPFRYVLLDSWWYAKGPEGGVANWSAAPGVFGRDGGVGTVSESTGWFVMAHNRWWSAENVYAEDNGGAYAFVVDRARGGAVPAAEAFWDALFLNASDWGLRVYEQDWLFSESMKVGALSSSPTLAREWLLQMGRAAARAGLSIQYCMAYSRHLLQSLEVPAVTQARASDDYQPGSVANWRTGGLAMLHDALGLAPSKDSFWSSPRQPGSPYHDATEPNFRLHAAVASLGAGPVQVSDGLGHFDVDLVMRCCATDGRLLQPNEPLKLVDAALRRRALPLTADGPDGDVSLARNALGPRVFHSLLAADLNGTWTATPAKLGLPERATYRLFDLNAAAAPTTKVPLFAKDAPVVLGGRALPDFQLYSLLPIESNGWALAGELNKWCGHAAARFLEVTTTPTGMLVEVVGSHNETITIGAVDPAGDLKSHACRVPAGGAVKIDPAGACFQ